jgi:hypothetical protein
LTRFYLQWCLLGVASVGVDVRPLFHVRACKVLLR